MRLSKTLAALAALLAGLSAFAATAPSQLIDRSIHSDKFTQNKIGTSPDRRLTVYLPPGYDATRRYPVIYFLPNAFDNYRAFFDQQQGQQLLDEAIAANAGRGFLFVTLDMTTPFGCSWYVNSPVTGNWDDFMITDLVPYIDANFRTLARRESRGIVGDRMGGYGAIRFGMRHPDVFGSVYALHPVGTGSGIQIMYSRPNWDLLWKVKSLDDLKSDPFSMVFATIFQAHLPDLNKPPLFVDLPARKNGDQLLIDSSLTSRLHDSFFLDRLLPRYADNLKTLRGFKFDWGRNDTIQDHVYANQALTHKLDEFGVPYEAEEYHGIFGENNWGRDGRIYTEVLPFFDRHLKFDQQ